MIRYLLELSLCLVLCSDMRKLEECCPAVIELTILLRKGDYTQGVMLNTANFREEKRSRWLVIVRKVFLEEVHIGRAGLTSGLC